MTKRPRETAGCIVRKTPRGLSPVHSFDQEQLMSFPPGTEFDLKPRTKRSVPQHRLYWQALSLVCQSGKEKWATPEHLHDALKRACGYVTVIHDLKGRPFVTTDSTAFDAMKQDEFKAYFDKAMEKLAEAIGYDPLAFMENAA